MLAYKKGTNIILLGDVMQCKTCYYKYKNIYNIVGFSNIDIQCRSTIYGHTVYPIDELQVLFGAKVVILSNNWYKVCSALSNMGLRFFYDYIPYSFFEYIDINLRDLYNLCNKEHLEAVLNSLMGEKEGCVIHGNCQTMAIIKYLNANKTFTSKYIILKTPLAFAYDDYKMLDCKELFNKTSLLLEMYIKDTNRYSPKVSTEQFEQLMPKECKKIIIPNFWFEGYFPQHTKNEYNVLTDVDKTGLFFWGDKNVNELVKNHTRADDIIDILVEEDFYSKEELESHFAKCLQNVFESEQEADIKMYDYIAGNYQNQILFYSVNHPVNSVIKELVIRIILYLGLEDSVEKVFFNKVEILDSRPLLKGVTETVYPAVIKYLGIENGETWTYSPTVLSLKNQFFTEEPNFEECIREMLNNCFGIV